MAAPSAAEFARWKQQCLSAADLSRKGSIDEPIVELVNFINGQEFLFTTSSCSGRISVFAEKHEEKKKGCDWLMISHSQTDTASVMTSLRMHDHTGSAVFKFEPFVLHVQCRTIQDARLLHQAGVQAGFRNSGISLGSKGKVVVAIRSTHTLEAPLSDRGRMLVDEGYVSYLVTAANGKLEENQRRVQRFFCYLKEILSKQAESVPSHTVQHRKDKHQETHKNRKQQQEGRSDKSATHEEQDHSDDGVDLHDLFEGS
ncbi:PREDICTED: tRNA wybutosine-synthesizing protein 3 homolog [Branchiostoma belcheri]|uniref:tRNA wybutosine-synthesizing protein 3 homolog n=1 Tax=Branchiostoma belcheri TaxID=7741 RepID=A0A6P4XC21_BRABE|nr:PREDICTED: tRNA wybutosine-synthesizing protein 3 homolog [Branchiostoma belcheri]